MPDNTLSTLEQIRIKIRRLTRSPSSSQITDTEIDNYVNTFVLYDFPQEIKIDSLKRILSFYTSPYIDKYENNTTDPEHPLYNFKNKYSLITTPVYIAGYQAYFTKSLQDFYNMYPKKQFVQQVATGDGITSVFDDTLTGIPVLRNEVGFSSVDINGNPLIVYDDGNGNLIGDVAGVLGDNTIDYITGEYELEFDIAPATGEEIWSSTYIYNPSRPNAVLLYDDVFYIRPIPDKTYKIEIETLIRPTELLDATDQPEISQWWQYISYGAAIKIYQDRSNVEGVAELMREFQRQERMVLRKTISSLADERTSTIFVQQTNINSNLEGNRNG